MYKPLTEITRKEWIAFRWVEVPPTMGDSDDRIFRSCGKRTPDEALEAMDSWDETAEYLAAENDLSAEE